MLIFWDCNFNKSRDKIWHAHETAKLKTFFFPFFFILVIRISFGFFLFVLFCSAYQHNWILGSWELIIAIWYSSQVGISKYLQFMLMALVKANAKVKYCTLGTPWTTGLLCSSTSKISDSVFKLLFKITKKNCLDIRK